VAQCLSPTPTRVPDEKKLLLRSFRNPRTGEILDELMIAWFKGPRSFTGEDTVELYCHGGSFIISQILSVLFDQGVAPAKPGEFTKRALLNGKLDMTAAEGIKTLVEAQSHQQWLAGRQLYSGKLRSQIEILRTQLIEAMAWLVAAVNFPDEGDTQHVQLTHVTERVSKVEAQIKTLIGTFRSGKIANDGLMVAFAGAPNAGKSTLLNKLLGHNRAIVSDQPGTTRDYIEEKYLINGRLVRLVDMAGIRASTDQVEAAGIQLSKDLIQQADVVIALFAANSSDDERQQVLDALQDLEGKPILKILTKADLSRPAWASGMLAVSSHNDQGLDDFKNELQQIVDKHVGKISEHPFITSVRQQNCLLAAEQSLSLFWSAKAAHAGHELLAFELQATARALSEVIGDLSNEDILDKVFSDFCIGK